MLAEREKRGSSVEWSGSPIVTDSGSSNTVVASPNPTPCLRTFAAAFRGSHRKRRAIETLYPDSRETGYWTPRRHAVESPHEALHWSLACAGRPAAARGGTPGSHSLGPGARHHRRSAGQPGRRFQRRRRARAEEERGAVPSFGLRRHLILAEVVELLRRLLQVTGGGTGIQDLGAPPNVALGCAIAASICIPRWLRRRPRSASR